VPHTFSLLEYDKSNLLQFYFRGSLDLEEASVRTNLALSQKKLLNEMDDDLYEESEEYRTLCKNVVRTRIGRNEHIRVTVSHLDYSLRTGQGYAQAHLQQDLRWAAGCRPRLGNSATSPGDI
jgi:hypothetical protein